MNFAQFAFLLCCVERWDELADRERARKRGIDQAQMIGERAEFVRRDQC